ncbi:MAG: DUF4301 family protein [Ekhidna sp.]
MQFSSLERDQLQQRGISISEIEQQIENFRTGFPFAKLAAPATIGDGIKSYSESEVMSFISEYEDSDKEVVKFVPASGAASRMFKKLFNYLETGEENEATREFFDHIRNFAFYRDLKNACEKDAIEIEKQPREVIAKLLTEQGLGYGSLPKGLLKFHVYDEEVRTPAQEQVIEGLGYAQKGGGIKLHFTVSPQHLDKWKNHLSAVKARLKHVEIDASFSIQKPSTDTIAVDMDNQPFKTDEGTFLLRPAGHGAILENLNDLEADIIFIKNIDNVVPDRLKEATIQNKKMLAGVLLHYQKRVFQLLSKHDNGEDIFVEGVELLHALGVKGEIDKDRVASLLNRPTRVCGVVKNEGEPGGGPFWVEKGEEISLQIVESAQMNKKDPDQKRIFKKATHFNPVDVVCGVRDYRGKKFDLLEYRDLTTGIITEKTHQGRSLKAQELPGLWNGSMANWNTVFVEVPLSTFNPVKSVLDLLRPQHR